MTRIARDRILKDVNGNISDHLHNHIHLTNCIHLKNHMHKHSPILADRALMRGLVVLQRSRSLKDPSASSHSWHSHSVVDMLLKRGKGDALVNGRRSVNVKHPKECGKMSESSPVGPPVSKAATLQLSSHNHRAATAVSNGRIKDAIHELRRVNRDESSERFIANGGYKQDWPLKILSEQLNDIPADSDDLVLSCNHDGRYAQVEEIAEEIGANIGSHGNNTNREKRRKSRGARRNRPSIATRDAETQNEMSVASNSFAQEYDGHNVTGVPRNGCGIPWNWSRIHHRGKSFIDMAGRSISCGLSESRLKKEGSISRRGISDMPAMSDNLSSSTKSDGEAFPLLLDASGSQGSMDHAAWRHDYSGELGIFADNLLKQEIGSDLASEGGYHEQRRFRRQHTNRHQNLTQKYMPRTFRDLVGQHLVVQALSNAIMKKKVGLLYVFYGPHGTGKTTCARIFARALNCQSLENPKPCGVCDSCVAHDTGKSRNIREISPVSNIDFRSIIEDFDNVIACQHHSQYRVFIFDECDTFSPDCWSAILKVIDRAPRRVVFVLACSRLDVLPHIIISRCQKFVFSKLKDADLIYTLQWIATKEDLEIDKDALKLIASRSDGSMMDAVMTLDQLSLLGQKISLCLVQELVGLISDEKLVDLLDLALSADTVNTVKNLRDIMESGVEPLALMSQLATVITDILAGSYDILKERPRRKFFQQQALSRDDMEKLRQALKTLSEAEKQLRLSNDRMTWLTAALLQLAPDQHYMLPGSSTDTTLHHSPIILNNSVSREGPSKSNAEMHAFQAGSSGDVCCNSKLKGIDHGKEHVGDQVDSATNDRSQMYEFQLPGKFHQGIEEIWSEVLEKIPINSLKEFMYQEGKLISLSFGAAPTVQLLFSSQLTKSEVEKYRSHILQAFESVLRSPVTIEIRCESRNDIGAGPVFNSDGNPIFLTSNGMPMANHNEIRRLQNKETSSGLANRSEIVEVEASPKEYNFSKSKVDSDRRNTESAFMGQTSTTTSSPERRKLGDRNQSLDLVRGKVSLGHVIHHAEGCSQHGGWSMRKAVSIAEKLEQENLRLEPRSRGLRCWHPPNITRPKLSRLKIGTRKPQAFLKFVSCGRCYAGMSPR
ncbi:hypothetical protein DH2020_042082 [Rehmannia glutinosa]|uniref:AAA+ ATPase domain-containing protein n=1 Tax=Rehmannia glutinosa TaxID=99300 RepID=A0ABR0UPI7_REHGL